MPRRFGSSGSSAVFLKSKSAGSTITIFLGGKHRRGAGFIEDCRHGIGAQRRGIEPHEAHAGVVCAEELLLNRGKMLVAKEQFFAGDDKHRRLGREGDGLAALAMGGDDSSADPPDKRAEGSAAAIVVGATR